MKNTIKNLTFLDKIQGLQLKISKCFESNDIIYCNSIFVQLPTVQFKIVQLNPLSFYKNEETITITITKENFKIESTKMLYDKEISKLEKLFCKKQCTHRFILVQKENISMQNEADDLDFLENEPVINNSEEKEVKREWVKVKSEDLEIDEILDKNTIEDISKNSLETIETLINNDSEKKEQKREWKQVQEFEIEFKKEPVITL